VYDHLNEDDHQIRLLTVLPGNFDDDIQIILRTERLTETHIPHYEALSYAWGSRDGLQKIFVGPTTCAKQTLAVTRNLAEALRYLRLKDEHRVMWIDAICVNQKDLAERSKQVKRMANVYGLAFRVVIWLGEGNDRSNMALRTLEDLSSKVKIDFHAGTLEPTSLEASEQHWADCNIELPLNLEQTLALEALLTRPWFERLWVWQEARLANENSIVLCGSTQMPWSTFRKSVVFRGMKPHSQGVSSPLLFLRAATLCSRRNYSFRYLAQQTQFSKCEDPRDRGKRISMSGSS